MPWELAAAGVSAAASLLGGRKGAKEQRRAIAEQNAYNAPSAIRARAEEAGFNPLLFVGPGVGQQTALASPVMGQAIANAGLAIADGVSEYGKQQAYATALEQQNAELRKAVEKATIRPKVPGIYGAAASQSVPDAPDTSQNFLQINGAPVPDVGEVPVEHKWIKIYDRQSGQFTWYPNPDLMDAGPTEMATGMATIGAAEGAQHGMPGGFDFMLKPPRKSALFRDDDVPFSGIDPKRDRSRDGSVPRISVRP